MFLRQFLHTNPTIAASYLFGCAGKGVAAVVDPVAEPDVYADAAADLGVRIRYVVDTHLHADHLSSGRALSELVGAEYVLHESADVQYAFRAVGDGERLELGNVTAEVLHVPGHTPEHLALLVTDRTRAPEPWLVFTGHTLMVGDMGRTELAAGAEDGARALFASARRLKALPDHVQLFPGAYSGSVCGRGLSGNPVSTIGFERRFNRAFAVDDAGAFVDLMVRDVPPRPPQAEAIRAANRGVGEESARIGVGR
jgi:glyoxylase-like metal-dependent hydrolase (beta-lactamase superfamily II)